MFERISMYHSGQSRALTFDGGPPLVNSATTAWSGPRLEMHRMRTLEVSAETGPLDTECGLMVVTQGQIDIIAREGRREHIHRLQPGSTTFVSGHNRTHVLRMRGDAEVMALHLSPPWFERLLLSVPTSTFTIPPQRQEDPTVLALARTMVSEVARGAPTGRIFAESISVGLLSYVFQGIPLQQSPARGVLAEAQQRKLRNHILEHLGEDLSLVDLSALVNVRPRQFTTLFRRAFGTTPHRYVLNARLSEGARLLAHGGADIADIALKLGFCSQSHFTAAFRSRYGVTPRAYAIRQALTFRAP